MTSEGEEEVVVIRFTKSAGGAGNVPCLNLSILLLIVLWLFELVHLINIFTLYTVSLAHSQLD